MAISISSLSPVNPTTVAGGTITFTVNATESVAGQTLSYEWQYSLDSGSTYTSSGLFSNTSSVFTTSPLSQNQTGLYFRVRIQSTTGEVVFSNQVAGIGNRIVTVQAAPTIIVAGEYDPSYTVGVDADITLSVTASLLNVDVTTATNLSSLTGQWQQSTDNGTTWTNVVDNMPGATGSFKYDITTANIQTSTSPSVWAKTFTLQLVDVGYASNLYQYRLVLSYPSASNTPTTTTPTVIIVNPTISIVQQPGQNTNDTKVPVQCYKTSIANSGSIRSSVSAFTTSGLTVAYTWEYAIVDYDGNLSGWSPIQVGIDRYWFRYKTGTNGSTDVLQLDRVIYFDRIAFRAIISGSSGETPVTSDPHYIYMKDVQVSPTTLPNKDGLEDFYDPAVIPYSERYLYTDYPIQTVEYNSGVDIAKNTGLNGKVTFQFQRKAPGSTTWTDIGSLYTYTPQIADYTATPSSSTSLYQVSYITNPLRISIDHLSTYRLKITSSSLYTLSGTVKTLTPYYSNESSLSVYRVIYIDSQPVDATVYSNQTASYNTTTKTTSPATVTYQWQDSTSPTSGWTNITNGTIGGVTYSGALTNFLTLTSVNTNITKRYFRCVASTTQSLSSAISNSAKLNILKDSFTSITSLNDYSVDEFSPVTWIVESQSLSLASVTYQWEKSTNFSSLNPSAATWTNIAGQTTSTYTIASAVKSTDEAYYRCKLTSSGGEVLYTNVASLRVNRVEIQISQNIPTTATLLEGAENEITFSVKANATKGPAPTYQWQIRRTGDAQFSDLGLGYNGQAPTFSTYTPRAFDAILDNGAKIRCKITAAEVPNIVYSNECTITVNRRFYYFADNAVKNIISGGNLFLDLDADFTGGSPTYQWQTSTNNGSTWSNISGETSPQLFVSNVTVDGQLYRCQVTLTGVTQFQYSRNNLVTIQSVSGSGFTQTIEINIASQLIKPNFYSKQIEKTGASIGTVICVPKPADYINDAGATTDDILLWKTSVSGDTNQNNNLSSLVSSGSVFNANKPSWVNNNLNDGDDYKAPKWLVSDDRFPGFIELRGQWLLKSEFALLYRIIGDTYGSTTTAFKLPNPYGKKIMGTGNVNNNGGNTSIIPLYNPDGTLGGDKNVAGSIGGVWNYSRTAQLPPGSPGNGVSDGTAGQSTAETFTIGNYDTTGFTECEGVAETNFSGNFNFTVGPIIPWGLASVPPHSHFGISAGYVGNYIAHSNGCRDSGVINPNFYGIDGDSGDVLDGPEYIPANERGIDHSHGISVSPVAAGNGSSNHQDGIGDTTAQASVTTTSRIEATTGLSSPSANVFLEPAPINLTNASRSIFNSSLQFYLRNNEEMPVNSNYFRLKYMIKAY